MRERRLTQMIGLNRFDAVESPMSETKLKRQVTTTEHQIKPGNLSLEKENTQQMLSPASATFQQLQEG